MICSSVNRLGFMSIPFQAIDFTLFGGVLGAQIKCDRHSAYAWKAVLVSTGTRDECRRSVENELSSFSSEKNFFAPI
jgi:hypothetical protein